MSSPSASITIAKKTYAQDNLFSVAVIAICGAFLFYKYVLQMYPSIITSQLLTEFQITGATLGFIGGVYYYSYVIMQFVVGILLDKYSVRWLTSIAILCCAFAICIFSQTTNLNILIVTRLIMGMGIAFATITYLKLASLYISSRYYAFVSGLMATCAMTGAVFGESALSVLIASTDWRSCLFYVGIAGILLALLFFAIVRDRKVYLENDPTQSSTISFKSFIEILKNPQNWILGLYCGLTCSAMVIFGGLWGNPFLQRAYGFSTTTAAHLVSLVFIGCACGSPFFGWIAGRVSSPKKLMLYTPIIATFALGIVIYWQPLPTWLLGTLLFTFGFMVGTLMLPYAIAKEINSLTVTASVMALLNTTDPLFDGITEPLIGKILDWTWDGTFENGIRFFSVQNYHWALTILPIYLIVSSLLALFLKDYK